MSNRLRVCELTKQSFTLSGLLDLLNPVETPLGNRVYHEEKITTRLSDGSPITFAVKVYTATQGRPRPTRK